jgi:transketolase
LRRADGPTALILSRQALDPLGPCPPGELSEVGARVVAPGTGTGIDTATEADPRSGEPRVTILASGSEVALAVAAATELEAAGISTRVVSVPWRERFSSIDADRRDRILGNAEVILAVEAGVGDGWTALTGSRRRVLGIAGFGASGPGAQVYAHLGLTVAALTDLAWAELRRNEAGRKR